MSSNKTKKELVQKTYDLLVNEGIESIKIRRIATEVGCTSPVIYKHFEDVDHLIVYASIRFLEGYLYDYKRIMNSAEDYKQVHLELWRMFSEYAFNQIHVFELLFWGKYKERLGDVIFEYYQLFREEMKDFDGMTASVLFSNDVYEREYIMIRRAAALGRVHHGEVEILAKITSSIFLSTLMEYKNKYREPGMAEEGVEKFNSTLKTVMDKYYIK